MLQAVHACSGSQHFQEQVLCRKGTHESAVPLALAWALHPTVHVQHRWISKPGTGMCLGEEFLGDSGLS